MAKKSSIVKNQRRRQTVAKYAQRRAALLSEARDLSLPMRQRFEAPAKAGPAAPRRQPQPHPQPGRRHRTAPRLYPPLRAFPHLIPGDGPGGPAARRPQGQPVTPRALCVGKIRSSAPMPVNDPVSDMLTRIRNAIQARHQSVLIPQSKSRRPSPTSSSPRATSGIGSRPAARSSPPCGFSWPTGRASRTPSGA